ncbi:MAG: hypothetical protein IPP15_24025 [Saprospiraceae bacterium]|uniref:Uncharacterized protein n=1 Tax=Candidatus Opimibacter skivensis TaxID=2982028 RepID=A0A9D7T168_9BACT|nr:hypothetical protein [Candidatus Opimibacter skivensis]
MKSVLFSLLIVFSIACSKEDQRSYPIVYNFYQKDQTDIGQYLITNNHRLIPLSPAIGNFGFYKADLIEQINELTKIAFDVRDITLLSKDSLNIHFFTDDEEFNAVLGYTIINEEIRIDSSEEGLLTFDKNKDQFIVCWSATFPISGPNAILPSSIYNSYNDRCLFGYSNEDYAQRLLDSLNYQPFDTIGVILTKIYYQ